MPVSDLYSRELVANSKSPNVRDLMLAAGFDTLTYPASEPISVCFASLWNGDEHAARAMTVRRRSGFM